MNTKNNNYKNINIYNYKRRWVIAYCLINYFNKYKN